MAVDQALYSPQQWRVAILAETTLGTKIVANMFLLNVIGVPSVNYGITRDLTVHHGVGRTSKVADVFVNQANTIKEISFTAFYNQNAVAALLENLIGVAVGASPASFDIVYNFTPPETGDGDSDSDWTGAMTCAITPPETGMARVFPGCFVSSLKIVADPSDDGGRFKVDVVLKSGHNALLSEVDPTFSATDYYTPDRSFQELSGASEHAIDGNDIIISKFDLELISNVQFYGANAAGEAMTIARAVPEIEVNGVFTVKADGNTIDLVDASKDENTIVVAISDNVDTWASATFGILGSFGEVSADISDVEVSGGAFLDIPVKFMASSSGDVIQIVP